MLGSFLLYWNTVGVRHLRLDIRALAHTFSKRYPVSAPVSVGFECDEFSPIFLILIHKYDETKDISLPSMSSWTANLSISFDYIRLQVKF